MAEWGALGGGGIPVGDWELIETYSGTAPAVTGAKTVSQLLEYDYLRFIITATFSDYGYTYICSVSYAGNKIGQANGNYTATTTVDVFVKTINNGLGSSNNVKRKAYWYTDTGLAAFNLDKNEVYGRNDYYPDSATFPKTVKIYGKKAL